MDALERVTYVGGFYNGIRTVLSRLRSQIAVFDTARANPENEHSRRELTFMHTSLMLFEQNISKWYELPEEISPVELYDRVTLLCRRPENADSQIAQVFADAIAEVKRSDP